MWSVCLYPVSLGEHLHQALQHLEDKGNHPPSLCDDDVLIKAEPPAASLWRDGSLTLSWGNEGLILRQRSDGVEVRLCHCISNVNSLLLCALQKKYSKSNFMKKWTVQHSTNTVLKKCTVGLQIDIQFLCASPCWYVLLSHNFMLLAVISPPISCQNTHYLQNNYCIIHLKCNSQCKTQPCLTSGYFAWIFL